MTELDEYLSNLKIDYCDEDDYTKSLEYMILNNSDVVYYNHKRKFYINNIGVLELDKNNKSVYDIELNDGDLIKNIQCNVDFKLLLGGYLYDKKNVLISNSQYHEKKIRLLLDPNNLPEYINVSYDVYLFGQIRKNIQSLNIVKFDDLYYSNGMILYK